MLPSSRTADASVRPASRRCSPTNDSSSPDRPFAMGVARTHPLTRSILSSRSSTWAGSAPSAAATRCAPSPYRRSHARARPTSPRPRSPLRVVRPRFKGIECCSRLVLRPGSGYELDPMADKTEIARPVTCRMFETPLIERFSRVHPAAPFVFWLPVLGLLHVSRHHQGCRAAVDRRSLRRGRAPLVAHRIPAPSLRVSPHRAEALRTPDVLHSPRRAPRLPRKTAAGWSCRSV